MIRRSTGAPRRPRVSELKFYAKGVGPVLAASVSGEAGDREELLSYSPTK